jgi:hypothetical protein
VFFFFFVTEDQITQPPFVVVGQVVLERNVYLLLSSELDNGQCDAVLPVEWGERERIIFGTYIFMGKKHFL